MTTLAIKDGVMAADSRVTGDSFFFGTQKIQRLSAKSLAGIVGDAVIALTIVQWLRSKRVPSELHKLIPPDGREDACVVELTPTGIFIWNGHGVPLAVSGPIYACGSGAQAAMAAMILGDTAEAAVKLAIRLDEGSGPPVQVESLKPTRKR